MDKNNNIAERVKQANRDVYNKKSADIYDKNESIFNEHRQAACIEKLAKISELAGNETFLDVGTGSGNLLRTAPDFFKKCYAIDLGENLLAQIKDKYPSCFLAAADAENLPFHNDSFNAVSCYAMLHHLYSHKKLLEESYRVLKKSGILYTDHDPNYFLNRFYHIFYKLRYQKNPGFGSDAEELAEYHNACSSGINPVKLKEQLLAIGFSQVEISYRITDRPNWNTTMKLTVNILKILSKIIPAKSFFTHFSIIAIK